MIVKLITTVEAKDRIEKANIEMKKTGLVYDVVYALPKMEIENENEGWTEGADSLRRTTIELVKDAIKSDDDLWIWEDDCVIRKPFFDKMMDDLELLTDFDFIHLNNSGGKAFSMSSKGSFRKTIDGVYNCQSYIVSNNALPLYLEELKVSRPIDASTKLLHRKRKKSYIVEPSAVSHSR